MHSEPMTNDSDRVAPDRRIHLPSPTPVRPRRRIAAGVLSVLLGLSCFAASPAWAVKLGEGANDTPFVQEYDNVAAYISSPPDEADRLTFVKIRHLRTGTLYTLKHVDLKAFDKDNTLDENTLIEKYPTYQAYVRDAKNTTRLYAYIRHAVDGVYRVYRVAEIEQARRDALPGQSILALVAPVEETPGRNTAIGDGASATEYRAIAIGNDASATSRGAVAIGLLSRASGRKSIAIGADANADAGIAMGRNARAHGGIALGRFAKAVGGVSLGNGANAVGGTAVGGGSWATGLHGSTAIGGGSNAAGERSTALGSIAKAGGSHSTAVGEASEAQGSHAVAVGKNAIAGMRVGKRYNNAADYLKDRTTWTSTTHTHVRIGNKVYKVTTLDAFSGLTDDKRPRATTVNPGGVAVGVNARATGMNSIALGRGASATGNKGIAIGSGVSAGQNKVVIGTDDHTYELPGLAKHTSGTRVVIVDKEGRLSTQAATSSPASPSRSASLRGAAVLSSEVTSLNRDLGTRTDASDYEKAPAIGSGPEAPETAEQRRVVVQDTNRDGSVRLRTLDFGDLTGMDRRLAGVEQRMTSLSDRLNKATAMSAALSALPNVVPGDNRFFLGVGAGHYSSEQALAIGMSARVGRHVFVNAGAALASGDDASVRGGVGVVW